MKGKLIALSIMFVAMAMLDVASTHLGLTLGATETNPVMRLLLRDNLLLNFLIRLVFAGLAILVIMKLVPEKIRYPVMLTLTLVMECVVSWNLGMIASMV